jgi:GTPase
LDAIVKRASRSTAGSHRPHRDEALPSAEDVARLPVVALVGRPNTGKSTLFNRLTHTRRALVAAQPGVTRDRNVGIVEADGRRFLLFDTGGFEESEDEEIGVAVRGQAVMAAEAADVVIVLVDGRAGLAALDRALLDRLRSTQRPLMLAVNKIDGAQHESLAAEFYSLGVERLYPVSAEHGRGIAELMEDVVAQLPALAGPDGDADAAGEARAAGRRTAVAVIGRPNVGKSSLINRLVGFERSIVTDIPGTTRDPLDTPISREGRQYLLVDTAGIRRRPRVQEHIERASVVRAFRALERAHVGVMVIDAVEGLTEQDVRVAGYAWERGRGLVVVVNKWDAVQRGERDRHAFAARAAERFPSLAVVPMLFMSALTGRGVDEIWGAIDEVAAAHRLRIATPELNRVVQDAVRRQAPPASRGRRPRLLYAVQTATAPPTITIFGTPAERVPETYRRYLVNQLRDAFPLRGTPLRLTFRARERKASVASGPPVAKKRNRR